MHFSPNYNEIGDISKGLQFNKLIAVMFITSCTTRNCILYPLMILKLSPNHDVQAEIFYAPNIHLDSGDSKLLVESINLQCNTLHIKLNHIIVYAGNALFLCTHSQHLFKNFTFTY